MNDLNLHISRLLLAHNCVIVPDLGGFVTQYCPAHFDEVAGRFVAPSYQVGFNPLLQADDGLLAQSFMMARGITYDEAMHDIRLCVHQLRETLRTRKEATLLSIGTFRLSATGNYDFTPIASGIGTPSLFGLAELPLQKLDAASPHSAQETAVAKALVHTATRRHKESYTFHIHKSTLRTVAAAAVAIVFYFVWAAPLNRNAAHQPTEAQMFDQIGQVIGQFSASPQEKERYQLQVQSHGQEVESISAEQLMSGTSAHTVGSNSNDLSSASSDQSSLATPTATAAVFASHAPSATLGTTATTTHRATTSSGSSAQQATAISQQHATLQPRYALVVASQVPLSGAQKLVQQLHSEGLTAARIVQHHNMVRVVVGSYDSYDNARQALKAQRKNSHRFSESWVLKED